MITAGVNSIYTHRERYCAAKEEQREETFCTSRCVNMEQWTMVEGNPSLVK